MPGSWRSSWPPARKCKTPSWSKCFTTWCNNQSELMAQIRSPICASTLSRMDSTFGSWRSRSWRRPRCREEMKMNPNIEARNPKQIQKPKFKIQDDSDQDCFEFRYLNFGFVSGFDIRISDLLVYLI